MPVLVLLPHYAAFSDWSVAFRVTVLKKDSFSLELIEAESAGYNGNKANIDGKSREALIICGG